MSTSVKWWHLASAGVFVVVLCGLFWKTNMAERTPNVPTDIAKGANADHALTIDMNGG